MPTFQDPRLGVAYSEALAEAYASAPETSLILDTLEFHHPTFVNESGQPTAARVVRSVYAVDATLEASAPLNAGEVVSFQPVDFVFRRPDEDNSGQSPEVEIAIDNVAKTLLPYLELAKESRVPIQVIYRPYLADDLTAPHMNPPLMLTLRDVKASMMRVTARAGYADLTNQKFPSSDYTGVKFPGLTAR